MTDTYLVTSYPPAGNGIRTIQADEFPELERNGTKGPPLPLDALSLAVKNAEAKVLAGHTSVRVWSLHGSPELIQVVKWSQDS